MLLPLKNIAGEQVGEVEVSDAVFAAPVFAAPFCCCCSFPLMGRAGYPAHARSPAARTQFPAARTRFTAARTRSPTARASASRRD